MESAKPWILIAILVLLIVLGIIVAIATFSKKKKHKPDYYTFFVIGIIWTVFGLVPGNQFFFILGLVFMALGLAHKKEWKKNRQSWKKMTKKQRIVIQVLLALGVILLAALVLYTFLLKRGYYCFG